MTPPPRLGLRATLALTGIAVASILAAGMVAAALILVAGLRG